MRSAASFYRTLLWCYPAPFRKEYGGQMVEAFSDQMREARAHGGWLAQAGMLARTCADLCVTAPREHRHVIKQDLRYALRTLVANPGFAIVAILSLALGIGANVAIFSLLNSVLLSALPVQDPDELVILSTPAASGNPVGLQTGERRLLTYEEFEQLRQHTTTFSALMASQSVLERTPARVGSGDAEELATRMVSAEYFTTLGVPVLIGRTFTGEDARVENGSPYAVISHALWQRRFGGRADAIGARLTIRRTVFTIVGVTPPAFFGETVGQRPDVWVPLSMQAAVLPGRDWLRDVPADLEKVMWLHVIGRLKPGVTLERAQAEANTIFQQGLQAFYAGAATPEEKQDYLNQRLHLRPAATGASQVRDQFGEPLLMLLAAAGVVLLIACANLANLLLARTTARSRELSVRLALGASRGRLIRQLLTESLCLAVLGGLVGLAAASLLRAGLLRLVSTTVVLPGGADLRVLAFSFVLTLVAGLLLGLLPALRTTRADATTGLKEQGRGLTGSVAWLRVSKLVVVVQLALSLPLLVGAGLLLRTLFNLQQADLGFPKDDLLLVRVDTRSGGYPEHAALPLFEQLLDRIRRAPGVRVATYSANGVFIGADSGDEIEVEGYTGKAERSARYDHVGADYFSTLGIPILLGRPIAAQDHPSAPRVCVINETFARRFFEGRSPIGLHLTQVFGPQRTTCRIVGVARNSRANRLRGDIEARFFVPIAQPINVRTTAAFMLRTNGAGAGMIGEVRRIIQQAAPPLAITIARPVAELVDERMVQDRLLARLSVGFGVIGLVLAAIGLYGVLSYGVARRTNEIGIRKALGAQHHALIGMLLRETGLLLVAGLLAGAGLSALTIRLIANRLYGLAPTDAASLAVAATLLTAVALAATAVPAWRASRIDPLAALRHE
jgi:predicted permease